MQLKYVLLKYTAPFCELYCQWCGIVSKDAIATEKKVRRIRFWDFIVIPVVAISTNLIPMILRRHC